MSVPEHLPVAHLVGKGLPVDRQGQRLSELHVIRRRVGAVADDEAGIRRGDTDQFLAQLGSPLTRSKSVAGTSAKSISSFSYATMPCAVSS